MQELKNINKILIQNVNQVEQVMDMPANTQLFDVNISEIDNVSNIDRTNATLEVLK